MILGVLQARTGSSRLPRKVLKPILGSPMLARQVERIQRCQRIDKLVVATSTEVSDMAIERAARAIGVSCCRGPLSDVLDRFYRAAGSYSPEHVVRLVGDCPLADPSLIDQIIEFHLQGHYDYSSNTIEPTFPDGLDIEVFRFHCLKEAWEEATLPSEREHVTPFIYKNPERYRLGNFKNKEDLSYLRWTVDEPLDYELVVRIYEALYPSNPRFTTQDIILFLNQHEELKTINTQYRRNEGYLESLGKDKKISIQ